MKKLLTFAFAVAAATMAQASYLYWQTSDASSFNGHDILGYNLYVGQTGSEFTKISSGFMDADGDAVDLPTNGLTGGYEYIVDVSSYGSGYSFYVEMIGYDTAIYGNGVAGTIGVGEMTSYDSLVQAGSIQVAGTALTIPHMWTGGAVAAPEPTSAMMILLGLAGLALKRKQV